MSVTHMTALKSRESPAQGHPLTCPVRPFFIECLLYARQPQFSPPQHDS